MKDNALNLLDLVAREAVEPRASLFQGCAL